MSATSRFAFDRDFDQLAAARRRAAAEAAPDPVHVARETALQRARAEYAQKLETVRQTALEEGTAQGRAAGRAAAEAELAGETRRLAAQLVAVLPELEAQAAATRARTVVDAAAFVGEAVLRLVPALEGKLGPERLIDFLAPALAAAPKREPVILRVAKADLARVKSALAELRRELGREGLIELVADAKLPAGEFRATWEQGGIALQPGLVAAVILEACLALGAKPPALPQVPPEPLIPAPTVLPEPAPAAAPKPKRTRAAVAKKAKPALDTEPAA